MKTQQICRGFTLIEVLVAIAIVAITLSALLINAGTQLESTASLKEKTVAQWVALNVLAETQLKNKLSNKLPDSSLSGDVTLAKQTWHWKMIPTKTDDENILRIDVSVYHSEKKDIVISETSGLIDKYHRTENLESN